MAWAHSTSALSSASQPESPGPATSWGLPPYWLTTFKKLGVGGIAGGAADVELLVELLHVVADVGVGEDIDDGDRLSLAGVVVVVAGEAAELVEAVGLPDLSRRVAGPRRC